MKAKTRRNPSPRSYAFDSSYVNNQINVMLPFLISSSLVKMPFPRISAKILGTLQLEKACNYYVKTCFNKCYGRYIIFTPTKTLLEFILEDGQFFSISGKILTQNLFRSSTRGLVLDLLTTPDINKYFIVLVLVYFV